MFEVDVPAIVNRYVEAESKSKLEQVAKVKEEISDKKDPKGKKKDPKEKKKQSDTFQTGEGD